MAGNYNLGTATGRILIDGAGAEIGFGIAQKAGQQFFDAIDAQLKSLKDLGQNMMKAGAVGAAGFAIAGNAAANYEQRLSAVKAVSGASTDEMAAISAAALKIGADTSFSASEAANAFEELVKAGISVQDTLDGAALATANLAAAGEISLPRAAEIAANAMNNFGLSGKQMPHIADLVAGAANASAISVEEFAQSLSQVGAVANLAGISFDDISVAIAEMGNAGIKGSDAGTSLKTMLMNLQPQTNAQVKEFEKLGLSTFSSEKALAAMAKNGITPVGSSMDEVRQAVSNYLAETQGIPNDTKEMGKATSEWLQSNGAMQNAFFDTSGKAKSLKDMQQVLQDSTKGMTQEQKLASLELLFGSDAIRGAAIMAKNGAAGYDQLSTAMGKVTAADVAATRLDNLKGSVEKLKGSWETLMIQLGAIFLPIVKQVVDGLTEFVNWLSSASERAKTFIVSLGAFGTAVSLIGGGLLTLIALLGPFIIKMIGVAIIKKIIMGGVDAVKFLIVAFKSATGPITFFRSIIAGLQGVFFAAAGAAETAAGAVGFFGRVALFAMGPWGKLIQLVFFLAAAAVTLYNTWDPFKNLVDQIAGVINGVFSSAVAGMQGIIGQIVDGFNGVQSSSGPLADALFQIGQAAAVIWADLQKLGDLFMTNVVPALQQLWGILQQSFGDAFTQIARVVASDLMPAMKKMSDVFINQVFPALKQLGDFLMPIVGFLLQVAGAIIGGIYTALIIWFSFLIGSVIPAIIQFAGPVLGFLISAIAAIAGFIIQYLITPFVEFVTFLFGTVIPAVVKFAQDVGKGFSDVFQAIGGWIDTWLVKPIQGFIDFLTGTGKKAQDGGTGISEGITAGIASVQQWIDTYLVKPFNDFVAGLIKIKDDTIANVSAIAAAIAEYFKPLTDIIGAIVNFMVAVFSAVGQLIIGVITFLATVLIAIWSYIFAVIAALWNAFIGWMGVVLGGFVNWWNEVWGGFFNWTTEVWNGFINWVMVVWGGFINWIIQITDGFFAWWNPIWAAFADAIGVIWGGFVNWVQEIFDGFVHWIQDVANGFFGWWNGAWAGAMSGIQDLWNGFVAGIQGIWNGFMGFLRDAFNVVDALMGGGISRAARSFADGWNGLIHGAQDIWNGFVGWLNGIPGQIKDVFNGATEWLSGAGQKIIDGLIGGLKGAADDVKNFFTNLTANIPNWKGPAPLDKVLLLPAGKMIINSLWRGLDSGTDAIHKLLNDLNTSIPATVNAVFDPNLQGAIDGVLSGKASFSNTNKAPIVNVAPAKVTANFDAKVMLGNKDITDLVDVRVNEHFEEAGQLIETGVNS